MTDIDISSQQAAIDEFQSGPDDRPVLRARFEHNGSPRYMLYTIKRFGYDHDHGFHPTCNSSPTNSRRAARPSRRNSRTATPT